LDFSPRGILKRPKLAALLACIGAEWASLESEMGWLYAFLLPRYSESPKGKMAPIAIALTQAHPVALEIFGELVSLGQRLTLIRTIIRWRIPDIALRADINDKLLPAINKAGNLRNKFLHTRWVVCEKYPDALIRYGVFTAPEVYMESDFNEAIDRIIATRNSIVKIHDKVREAIHGK
jgi:hypothetical protein